jgi:hypothetical protein
MIEDKDKKVSFSVISDEELHERMMELLKPVYKALQADLDKFKRMSNRKLKAIKSSADEHNRYQMAHSKQLDGYLEGFTKVVAALVNVLQKKL